MAEGFLVLVQKETRVTIATCLVGSRAGAKMCISETCGPAHAARSGRGRNGIRLIMTVIVQTGQEMFGSPPRSVGSDE